MKLLQELIQLLNEDQLSRDELSDLDDAILWALESKFKKCIEMLKNWFVENEKDHA